MEIVSLLHLFTKMKKKKFLSNIVLLGLVSLFVDMNTEMVYPLVPLFLTATLGALPQTPEFFALVLPGVKVKVGSKMLPATPGRIPIGAQVALQQSLILRLEKSINSITKCRNLETY